MATMVAILPPGDHTDPAALGLQLRVRPKRGGYSRTWLLRYRWRSEWVRIVLGHAPGMSLIEARSRALELRKGLDDGIDPRRGRPSRRARPAPLPLSAAPAVHPDDSHSIDFLASEFIERYLRPTRRCPEYAEAILRRDILPRWRGRDARTIQPGEIVELLDGIIDRGSRVMANRVAALLGQLFKFGIQRRIVAATPVQLLYRPGGKERPRQRVLTDDELRAFLAAPMECTRYPKLAHVMLILLLTGQRRGELAAARWADINLETRTWTIPAERSKNGREHIVPLSGWAISEFEALRALAKRSAWALPASAGERHPIDPMCLSRGVARCLDRFKAHGIAAFTLHDLRRTCRTGLARLKIEPHIAERVLGHAQERIAATYDTHAYLDEMRSALNQWAEWLGACTAITPLQMGAESDAPPPRSTPSRF